MFPEWVAGFPEWVASLPEQVAGLPESLLNQGAGEAGQTEVKVLPFGVVQKGEFLGQSEIAHAENTRDTPAAF